MPEKGQAHSIRVRLPFELSAIAVWLSLLRTTIALTQSGTDGEQVEHVNLVVAVYISLGRANRAALLAEIRAD